MYLKLNRSHENKNQLIIETDENVYVYFSFF